MGSYLEINNRETNSKTLSSILVSAIRDIDSHIMSNENSTEKEKRYFVPEYYKKPDTGDFGCSDWTINKKGMALLVLYLKYMCEDEDIARQIGIEDHEYFLENVADESEMEERIAEFTESAKQSTHCCFVYATDVLTDMVLHRMKKVTAHWV